MVEKQTIVGWIHFISNLTRLHHGRQMSQSGFKPGQFSFLVTLYFEEGLSQDELSRRVGSDKSNASRILAEMEKIGLIRRETDPENYRVKRVYLQPKARRIEKKFTEMRKRWLEVLCEGFSEERKARLFSDLRDMARNAEQYSLEQERIRNRKNRDKTTGTVRLRGGQ